MKTTFHKTERHGHIDLFFIGSCRVSLLPTPPKKHSCSDASCTETDCTAEVSIEKVSYAKVFIRQGLKTHTIDIPSEHQITPDAFVSVFTCPYDQLPQYLSTGSTTEQWLAELREEYLGSLDPVESLE